MKETFQQKFAQFVKEKRKAKGMSQADLAKLVFDKPMKGYISEIESGARTGISTPLISRILDALDSDIEFIEN